MSGLHLSQRYKDWQFIQGEEHKEQDDDLISRQAVNEIINDIRDCISVEGYCAILERLKKLPSVNPQEPKWIPVNERLPDIHNYYQDYLITNKNRSVGKAFFTDMNGKQWWSVEDVIAWMPLPTPYEPQESEDKE